MAQISTNYRSIRRLILLGAGCLACCVFGRSIAGAAAPEPVQPALPAVLPLDQAVVWALEHNPEIAALRQQHGISAAAVVIAETYPYNPVWEAKVRAASGPSSAGVTNAVSNEHKVFMDVEVRGQGKYRRQSARMALSRTDWEIANQEVTLAIRVLRAYTAVLYRLEKVQLIQRMIEVNEASAGRVQRLVDGRKLQRADAIVARTEVDDSRALLAQGNSTLVPAWHELRRALGLVDENFQPQGKLHALPQDWDACQLTQAALAHRADLHARQAAVAETQARVRLAVADRYGNPNFGPAFEYDPTQVTLVGLQLTLPLPVFNTHRGDIMQRKAEMGRAILDLRQIEVQIRQDVQAALARLKQARAWLETYQGKVIPGLEASLAEMNRLVQAFDPGAGATQLIDINRKLLRARDAELDARWEVIQAQIDLAAAVGDPALVIAPGTAAEQLGIR